MFEYFYGNEIEQYLFYRVPQLLFTDEKFVKISCEAKLLYGFLLDRCGLSKKKKWYDDNGRIYTLNLKHLAKKQFHTFILRTIEV